MPAQIRIPHTLRRFTGHEEIVNVSADDVRAAIDELGRRFNGIANIRQCRIFGPCHPWQPGRFCPTCQTWVISATHQHRLRCAV